MHDVVLSWRLTWRDARAGELRLLLAALIVAVGAIASVGLFVDRMRGALELQARQLLGADLIVESDRTLPPAWREQAEREGLATASTVVFPSMVMAGTLPQLASVKAVSAAYPLRGAVRVADAPGAPDRAADGGPASGEIWLDPQLVDTLQLAVGDSVQLGDARFRLSRVITLEPDRGAGFVNFAPRAMIALDDLAATGLIQPASRVRWHLLLAGDQARVAAFESWVAARLERGQEIESLATGRPELGATLTRAEQFLSLVALLSALIAAVAIALAARRFAERHLDGAAVIRSLGVTQPRLVRLLLLELGWVAVAGALLGLAVGWAVHLGLVQAIQPLIAIDLPMPGLAPVWQAGGAAIVLMLGFGAFPFLGLAGVPPLRVLRREIGPAPAPAWGSVLLAVFAFALLLFWFSNDRRLAMLAIGGFGAATLLFAGISALAVRGLDPLRHARIIAGSPALRLAFASWSRRRAMTIVQTSALAVGLMALLLLTVTRNDLIDGWRAASPPDAPNRFVINIQPDQRDAVMDAFSQAGISPDLYPMIRGRLVAVNGQPLRPEDYDEDRAQRLIDREFNLSYADERPAHNLIAEGRWFSGGAEVSVEQGIMDTLRLSLDDVLDFDIAGETVTARLTSVRRVAWDSMKVNFFMILSPQALGDQPQTLITAYRQPPVAEGSQAVDRALVARFPNLTVFDTGNIIRQVQAMIDQVVRAVQVLFVLTLAAGVVVLWGALASSRDERVREAALMRALGASRRQLAGAQLLELAMGGALAGLLAAIGALAIGWGLAAQVFRFEFAPQWLSLPLGALAGLLLAVATGWLSLRPVLSAPPLASLRQG
ncbi:MAG: FtsX-like permease family protein [Burkholderiaceae bacterium]